MSRTRWGAVALGVGAARAVRAVRAAAAVAVAVAAVAAAGAVSAVGAAGAVRAAAAASGAAGAVTPPALTPANARLEGEFLLKGRVTVAVNVRGEHAGDNVSRTWAFTPTCPTGPCQTIGLVRRRATGSDSLLLRLQSPGYYVGTGSFYAPLRCGGRVWRRGATVPFTIAVRVTNVVLAGGEVVAISIQASYANRSRSNRTPCVAALGHDAATYSGQFQLTAPPTGGTGTGGGGS
jgi:hypothetical protein